MSKKKTYYKQVNAQKLSDEIKQVTSLSDLKGITTRFIDPSYEVDVVFESDKDTNAWATCDQIVTSHEIVSLEDLKKLKNAKIDARTVELIECGVAFDGKIFSLSSNAQRNWIAIMTFFTTNPFVNAIKSTGADRPTTVEELLSHFDGTLGGMFPMTVTTKADGEYVFNDISTYIQFFNLAISTAQSYYDSGRLLKTQVNNAVDAAEIDSVIDDREKT